MQLISSPIFAGSIYQLEDLVFSDFEQPPRFDSSKSSNNLLTVGEFAVFAGEVGADLASAAIDVAHVWDEEVVDSSEAGS